MGEAKDNPKSRLRRDLDARRQAVAAEELARASTQICAHVRAWPGFDAVRHLVLYAARRYEIDPIALEDADATIYYPRVEGPSLAFRESRRRELVPGRFGVLEPVGEAPALPADAPGVLVLVPGVAFDRHGGRLGTGQGFYDRALAGVPAARRVGLALDALMVERVPTDVWDVPMHAIATERGFFIADPGIGAHSGDPSWT
jgi:5-formyltetrahydrofolate cyclo-ligase